MWTENSDEIMTDNKHLANHSNNNNVRGDTKSASIMVWLTWIVAIALVVWLFQEKLDEQWNPNEKPATAVDNTGRNTVTLLQNRYGHYVTQGQINQQPVIFMLDTGATQVSVPSSVANRLGLISGNPARVNTANGSITVYSTMLDSVSLGNITLCNVAAHINPAMDGEEILLGMSALKNLDFAKKGTQLIITQQRSNTQEY